MSYVLRVHFVATEHSAETRNCRFAVLYETVFSAKPRGGTERVTHAARGAEGDEARRSDWIPVKLIRLRVNSR